MGLGIGFGFWASGLGSATALAWAFLCRLVCSRVLRPGQRASSATSVSVTCAAPARAALRPAMPMPEPG